MAKVLKTRPKESKPISYRNADCAADIARACKIPVEVAENVLSVILKYLVKQIRANQFFSIDGFGRFRKYKFKRIMTPFGFKQVTKWSYGFVASDSFKERLYQRLYLPSYPFHLVKKIKRLQDAGNKKKAKHHIFMLKKYLRKKRPLEQWLLAHTGLPYDPRRNRSDDAETC